jgi:hypothetical protein
MSASRSCRHIGRRFAGFYVFPVFPLVLYDRMRKITRENAKAAKPQTLSQIFCLICRESPLKTVKFARNLYMHANFLRFCVSKSFLLWYDKNILK